MSRSLHEPAPFHPHHDVEDSNPGRNPTIHEVSGPARRQVLRLGFGAAATAWFAPWLAGCAAPAASTGAGAPGSLLGFQGIAPSTADALVVPEGYVTQVVSAWGDAVGLAVAVPAWRDDASHSAADQAVMQGMHHDGLHFYALPARGRGEARGLLVSNHEYTDDGLLHPDGLEPWNAQKVAKSQAAHGISVIEVELRDGRWNVVRPSPFARRITAATPFEVGGPAAGHVLMRTAADPTGRRILGTFSNCAAGRTPWGTFLSGEENWAGYFHGGEAATYDQRRWGIRARSWYRWDAHDERFDARKHPNEFHRHGWIVELDPMDPASPPVKRTALGRAAHEGAWVAVTKDNRAVVYSGEDAAFEFIYKFVSRDPIATPAPGQTAAQANRGLLDHGTLYVARFDADGTGRWLPLVHGQGPLVAAHGFADAGEVVIKTRQACDLLGATRMDRPEWLAIDPRSGEVYCTLTNNSQRGAPGHPGTDAANPRANNTMGHIIRWKEDGDFDGTTFRWDHLLLAGDPANEREAAKGNIRGDAFACPDGITFDDRGVLWIQSDLSPRVLNRGEMARLGNNQMLACDVRTGEVRRFMAGPVGCEITGCAFSPDGRTMFVNIQHPGETPGDRSDPAQPRRYSNWPDFRPEGRPRSATVAIRRRDGGVIGT